MAMIKKVTTFTPAAFFKSSTITEISLIQHLIHKCDVQEYAYCEENNVVGLKAILLIDKDKFSQFQSIFNLEIKENP
jgi:hypothetical protein